MPDRRTLVVGDNASLVPLGAIGCLIVVGLAVIGRSAAAYENFLFTSNSYAIDPIDTGDTIPDFDDGVRVVLGSTSRTLTGSTVTDAPCIDDDTAASPTRTVAWTTEGRTWGVARDRDMGATPFIWTSASNVYTPGDCGGSNGCIGSSFYDLDTGDIVRSEYDYWDGVPSRVSDVIADHPVVVVLNKEASWGSSCTGAIQGWNVISGIEKVEYECATDASQLVWVDDEYFLATLAEGEECIPANSSDGAVWLGTVPDSSPTPVDTESVPGGSGAAPTKPKGIAVAPISASGTTGCNLPTGHTPDYMIYVGDYCNSTVYMLTLDLSATGGLKLVGQGSVSVGEDEDGDTATTENCSPSSVEYHRDNKEAYVVCQTEGSTIRLHTQSNGCAPTWEIDDGDHAELQYWDVAEDGQPPTCSDTGSATVGLETCVGASCGPHDVAYDKFSNPGWLFVALTQKGQIVAIDEDDMENQVVVFDEEYGSLFSPGTFKPQELELVPSEDPTL